MYLYAHCEVLYIRKHACEVLFLCVDTWFMHLAPGEQQSISLCCFFFFFFSIPNGLYSYFYCNRPTMQHFPQLISSLALSNHSYVPPVHLKVQFKLLESPRKSSRLTKKMPPSRCHLFLFWNAVLSCFNYSNRKTAEALPPRLYDSSPFRKKRVTLKRLNVISGLCWVFCGTRGAVWEAEVTPESDRTRNEVSPRSRSVRGRRGFKEPAGGYANIKWFLLFMCTYCNFFSLTFSNFISDRLLKAVVGQIGEKPAGSNQNYPSSPRRPSCSC